MVYMSVKIKIIGKYYFTDKEIQNMKKMLEKTKKFNFEFAARISSNKSQPGELKLTCTRLGDDHSVDIPNNCGKTRIGLGVFHTHTKGTDNMSIADLQIHMSSDHNIECVGGDGKISCYKRKKMKNFRENILSDITIAKSICSSLWMEEGNADLIAKEIGEMAAKFSAELTEKYFNRIRLL
jgi:hypothetical protein